MTDFKVAPAFAHLDPDEAYLGEGIPAQGASREEWRALVDAARGSDMLALAQAHGARLRRSAQEWVGPCPRCGGHDRFAINRRKNVFNCRGCGKGGGPIDLEMLLGDCDFIEAVRRLTDTTSPSAPRRSSAKVADAAAQREREAEAEKANKLALVERIWRQSLDIAGTAGEAYLARRGIALEDVPNFGGLRFHPNCPWEGGTAPCVLARFTDAISGESRGIWRRPINGAKPKTLGPMGGCVIRLWPDQDVNRKLVLGEGVETTLAAATRVIHRNTLLRPAWAAGSAGNLENFPVLVDIDALTLLVDHDENGIGQKAARGCGKRYRAAGREVTLLMPDKVGADFNDLVRP